MQQAYDNLLNVLTVGLRGGLFQDFVTLDVARASLEVLRNQGLPRITEDDLKNARLTGPPELNGSGLKAVTNDADRT